MRKMLCILLMLIFALPALAEDATLSEAPPYTLGAIEGVIIEEGEDLVTFVYGTSRVVAIIIDRVPDEKPAEAVIRMMGQFDPNAVIGENIPLKEGFVGVYAATEDKFGDGIDSMTAMVLSAEGKLLILSGYDMSGSRTHAQALLDAILKSVTADGQPILMIEK